MTDGKQRPRLCGATEPAECDRGHKCNLYAGHEVPHRADFCAHRWEDHHADET